MKAEDTVMSDILIKVWCLEFVQPGELDLNAKLKEFAKAQAEMTFKEGMREVMRFFGGHRGMPAQQRHPDSRRYYHCEESEIQTQLQDWGISEERE